MVLIREAFEPYFILYIYLDGLLLDGVLQELEKSGMGCYVG